MKWNNSGLIEVCFLIDLNPTFHGLQNVKVVTGGGRFEDNF